MDSKENKYTLIHIEPVEEDGLSITDFINNTKFNYTIKSNLYTPQESTMAIYDIYKNFIIDKSNKLQKPIITVSHDPAISGATIAGVCEKYMFSEPTQSGVSYNTDVKIIYIDSLPNISKKTYTHYSDFNDAVISDCLALTDISYTMSRVSINPSNICFIGLNEDIIPDEQEHTLNGLNTDYYSLQILRKKGIKKIMDTLIDDYLNENVHIVIDLSCMALKYAPCAIRQNVIENKDGFDIDELKLILNCLKRLTNINSIDVTGYNLGLKENKETHNVANKITINTIELILSNFIENYKKSLNIFDEESKFLIWKKLNDDEPIGWLILRNMSTQEKTDIINAIDSYGNGEGDGEDIDNESDRIITITVNDDDETYEAFVTTTTIKEQQEKSFYTSNNVSDCCLYPGEKLNMLFELITNK